MKFQLLAYEKCSCYQFSLASLLNCIQIYNICSSYRYLEFKFNNIYNSLETEIRMSMIIIINCLNWKLEFWDVSDSVVRVPI